MCAIRDILSCRRIILDLSLVLALLLLTNMFWSTWAALGMDEPSTADLLLVDQQVTPQTSLTLVLYPSRTVTRYDTYVHTDVIPKDNELTTDKMMPSWLARYLDTTGGHERWSRFAGSSFEAVGWPIRVLWSGLDFDSSSAHQIPWSGIPIDESWRRESSRGFFPVRPILSGQVVYVIFWWIVVSAVHLVRPIRRRFRVARGRCMFCNYDVRGNPRDVCPECGAVVQRVADRCTDAAEFKG